MIRAALFDMDNTLVDFHKMKKKSCQRAVSAMISAGLDIGERKALSVIYDLYDKFGMEDHTIFQKLLKKVRKKVDYRILAHGINAYRAAQVAYMVPYPNVVPTLISLKEMNLKLAIVTDAPKLKAYMRLLELGIIDFFDTVVAFEDTGEVKPSPKPFMKAMRIMKIKPHESIFIGDNPERDIAGGGNVGMLTVHAKYGFPEKTDIRADYNISNFSKVADIIRSLNSAG